MGFRLCVNLGAGFILENDEYRRDLNSLLLCSDVVIGNESEAQIYATKEGWGEGLLLKDIALRISRLEKRGRPGRLTIITCGSSNTVTALASAEGEESVTIFGVKAVPEEDIRDTTAAGACISNSSLVPPPAHKRLTQFAADVEQFTGGFLAKMVAGGDLTDCVGAAHYAARQIIQVTGCKVPNFRPPKYIPAEFPASQVRGRPLGA